MYQREISLEQAELEEKPEEERSELVLIYRAKGLSRPDAEHLADKIMADRSVALDTLAREELGLALAAMFGVGAAIGALNGRSAVRMGLRQMFVGALAAAVIYGVGHLIGANVS